MAFNCVLRWTLLPLLSYSAFAFDDSVHMKSQWLQKGREVLNLRSAAMVDMNNNFTLLFGEYRIIRYLVIPHIYLRTTSTQVSILNTLGEY